jgi:hypothetical protein
MNQFIIIFWKRADDALHHSTCDLALSNENRWQHTGIAKIMGMRYINDSGTQSPHRTIESLRSRIELQATNVSMSDYECSISHKEIWIFQQSDECWSSLISVLRCRQFKHKEGAEHFRTALVPDPRSFKSQLLSNSLPPNDLCPLRFCRGWALQFRKGRIAWTERLVNHFIFFGFWCHCKLRHRGRLSDNCQQYTPAVSRLEWSASHFVLLYRFSNKLRNIFIEAAIVSELRDISFGETWNIWTWLQSNHCWGNVLIVMACRYRAGFLRWRKWENQRNNIRMHSKRHSCCRQ